MCLLTWSAAMPIWQQGGRGPLKSFFQPRQGRFCLAHALLINRRGVMPPLQGGPCSCVQDQFTVRATEALQAAHERAVQAGHAQLEPLHLLLLLLDERGRQWRGHRSCNPGEGRGPRGPGAPTGGKRTVRGARGQRGADRSGSGDGSRFSPRPRRKADRLKDKYISCEHLLLALAAVDSQAKEVLSLAGATPEVILSATEDVRGTSGGQREPGGYLSALERYGRDLVELARKGKIDPVIGP